MGDAELLEAQTRLWNHMFNHIDTMSMKCAVELGIPDAIVHRGGAITVPELVSDLSISTSKIPQMRRLMRMLVQSGFFCRNQDEHSSTEEGSYSLTPISKLLTGNKSQSGFLLSSLHSVQLDSCKSMTSWFRTTTAASSPFEVAYGYTIWDFMQRDQEYNTVFNRGMASDSKFLIDVIIRNCAEIFEGIGSLVDVGGGTGEVIMAIKAAFPEVKCTVLDMAHVIDNVDNVENNVEFIAGNMFEFVPPADAVLLKNILHDWSDKDCLNILIKCKEAIIHSKEKGGKVIIIDIVVADDDDSDQMSRRAQISVDMMMMVLCAGGERTEKEWKKLFDEAGFADYKITPVGIRSVIELFP